MKSFLYSAAVAAALLGTTALRAQEVRDEFLEYEQPEFDPYVASDSNPYSTLAPGPTSSTVLMSFEGASQYDVAAVARNFIPPDTMGAVGTTQYMNFVNGGVAVYDKSTGARSSFVSDLAFWSAAGQTGANGDSRVMFDKSSDRWIALSFGNSVSDIQIAVSNTADALGGWQSTKFTGFDGGTADYPTLAIDKNAVYIGTNNFNAAGNFQGTTLNVIPIGSLLGAGAPSTTGRVAFTTPYTGGAGDDLSRGYAIQGVNSSSDSTTGHILSVSLTDFGLTSYDILNTGTAGATRTAAVNPGAATYQSNNPARQPNAVPDTGSTADFPNNNRVVDTLDDRVGSSVFEVNGKIYSVHTVTAVGSDFTSVRYDVIDATTKALLFEGDIGDGTHDYWEGSLAVNSLGQVVIGYDRSGAGADGNITFAAQMFNTVGNTLVANGGENVLKVSLVDDYHNGTVDGQIATGRQRWGDYSAVSVDPTDETKFWVIGEFAREYNDAAGGHPGGTGGSRWSTWIAELTTTPAVPEPGTWATMIAGFGLIGFGMRRRRVSATFA